MFNFNYEEKLLNQFIDLLISSVGGKCPRSITEYDESLPIQTDEELDQICELCPLNKIVSIVFSSEEAIDFQLCCVLQADFLDKDIEQKITKRKIVNQDMHRIGDKVVIKKDLE